jgi:predicted membrane protein
MSIFAFSLILAGNLTVILEFGSVTFLLISMLMAYTNFKIHKLTDSSNILTIIAMLTLLMGTLLIIYYEATTQIEQVYFIVGLYSLLTFGAWIFSKFKS